MPDSLSSRSADASALRSVTVTAVMTWPLPWSPGVTASLGIALRRAHGDDVRERRGAAQERRRPAVPGCGGQLVALGPGGEDALDGPVGRVPGRDGLRAGRLEPAGVVPVGQADDALGGAEPVERVVGEQLTDHVLAGRARCPAACLRHHCGVRMWKAIFSGG